MYIKNGLKNKLLILYLHPPTRKVGMLFKSNDSVAQLVEHNTFNVGVLGSSPSRVTKYNEE